jgi:hypothetical protein
MSAIGRSGFVACEVCENASRHASGTAEAGGIECACRKLLKLKCEEFVDGNLPLSPCPRP